MIEIPYWIFMWMLIMTFATNIAWLIALCNN